ncbi:MAG: hypothetical protein M3429_01530, partial [Verrucomicrobiota bacterium]|nr:hypothetical protein [Verrucomicrobiota bacterium]
MKAASLCLLVASSASILSLHAADAPPARVAAWNVACGRSATGATPIPPDRIERLGEVIAHKIKPDIIVLE